MSERVPSAAFIASQLNLLAKSLESGEFTPLDFEDDMRLHETTAEGSPNRTFDPGLMWIKLYYVRADFKVKNTK